MFLASFLRIHDCSLMDKGEEKKRENFVLERASQIGSTYSFLKGDRLKNVQHIFNIVQIVFLLAMKINIV